MGESKFVNNSVEGFHIDGGAVLIGAGSSGSMSSNTFSGNYVVGGNGGAIKVDGASRLQLYGGRMEENRAGNGNGGAISASGKATKVYL